MIMTISCKKQSTVPIASNNTHTSSLGAYTGTFINPNDINDQINLSQTTNSSTGVTRYLMKYYKYDKYSIHTHDTLLESQLLTAPYYETSYDIDNKYCQLYASTTSVLKTQISTSSGTIISTVTFNKQ